MNEQVIQWANLLGMLPVNFLHKQQLDVEKYAMLNGFTNNFCLSFSHEDLDVARSSAWSANMANYLSIESDNLYLFNIYKSEVEQIRYNYVLRNLSQFYEYLGSKQINIQDGIVPFVMRQYRLVRNYLREDCAVGDALKVFLYMLTQLDQERDIYQWTLPEGTDVVVARIGNGIFDIVRQQFRDGLANMCLVPDIKLLLRHCAGMLFQEANYVARFSKQLELFPTENIRYEMNPKMMGSYYTPSYIARTIVEESLRHIDIADRQDLTIFDPACGSGVFLIEALHQLQTKGYQGRVHVIGWDIDTIAIDMANFILQFEKNEWEDRMTFNIVLRNSIDGNNLWPNSDILLMNPPYNSWKNMSQEQRELASGIMSPQIRPNMASVFYYRAAQSLNTNGVIGCLMPSSFLTADSHCNIRSESYDIVHPRLIARLGNFVFTSAMADVCIIVASNYRANDQVQMLWTKNVDEVTPLALRSLRRENNNPLISFQSSKEFSIYFDSFKNLREKDSWMPLPMQSLIQKKFIEQRISMGGLVRSKELFNIMMGARTGANDVFIISGEDFRRIPTKERFYFRPSIDSTSLRYGVITPSNYVFYPYPEEEKGFEDEEDLKRKIPYVYHHFFEQKMEALTSREVKNGKWWLLARPGAWQVQPIPKIVSTEFGKNGSFAYDKKGEYVVERGMAWISKNHEVTSDFYYFYIAILNSRYFNTLLQIYARQLAGGDLYNLEGKYVRNIPLPLINAVDEQMVKLLINYGQRICKEGCREIEGLTNIIKSLYGE